MPRTDDTYTSDSAPGDVLISLTHPRGGGPRRIIFKVDEQMSGETLVEVNLTPEQLADILSGTATPVSGARVASNPHRIGKRTQNTATSIKYADGGDPERVRDEYLAAGWESVRIDKTNYGHRVVAYRWVDPSAKTVVDAGRPKILSYPVAPEDHA